MNYMTRQMVALRDMRHDGYELKIGDTFNATPVDAYYLITRGRAREVEAPIAAAATIDNKPAPVLPPESTTTVPTFPIATDSTAPAPAPAPAADPAPAEVAGNSLAAPEGFAPESASGSTADALPADDAGPAQEFAEQKLAEITPVQQTIEPEPVNTQTRTGRGRSTSSSRKAGA